MLKARTVYCSCLMGHLKAISSGVLWADLGCALSGSTDRLGAGVYVWVVASRRIRHRTRRHVSGGTDLP